MIGNIRIGTLSEWEGAGTIPDGVWAWAIDAGIVKQGNGMRPWASLPANVLPTSAIEDLEATGHLLTTSSTIPAEFCTYAPMYFEIAKGIALEILGNGVLDIT
jgi:hypothetical protein